MTRPMIRGAAWAALLAAILCLAVPAFAGQAEDLALRTTPVVRAVQSVAPAVVNITTARVVERQINPLGDLFSRQFGNNPFFRDFFGPGGTRRFTQQSLGSGVIIDGRQGLVLTNSHVIAGATTISAKLLDGREFEADLVGSDPDFDLAVLRLKDAHDLPQAAMGDSDSIMIGESVLAIGNPFGFSHTVTTGVVSAVRRTVRTEQGVYTDFLQTDTAINPGNSGGPLLNILGQLIGVNTAIQAQAEGIGFAIPVNKAKRVLAELLDQGFVSHVWLGLWGQDVDQAMASYFDLKSVSGMLVTEVTRGSPGERAGVRPGDVVLSLEGYGVEDKTHYLQLLRNFTKDRTLSLVVLRQGRRLEISIRAEAFPGGEVQDMAWRRWGFSLRSDPAVGGGLVVTGVLAGGPAQRLGMEPGDLVMKVGGVRLNASEDFTSAFARYRMHNSLLLAVGRGGRVHYVKLRL